MVRILREKRPDQCYLRLTDSTNQIPADTSETQVTFDTLEINDGINFISSTNEVEIVHPGKYVVVVDAQVGKDNGAPERTISLWFKRNGTDIAKSGVLHSLTVNDNDASMTDATVIDFDYLDTLTVYIAVDDATDDLGLYTFTPSVGASVPSITLNIYRI